MFRTRRVVEIFRIRSANRFQYPRFVLLTCKKLVTWYLWLLPRKVEKIQYTLLSEKHIGNVGPCRVGSRLIIFLSVVGNSFRVLSVVGNIFCPLSLVG